MPVPSGLASLSQTAGSNSPAGSDTVFPSLDDYLREIFADLARLRDGAHRTLTSVSGTDTITASCAQISTFAAGQVFAFVSAGANTTTTVTLNINGSGAKNVLRAGGAAMAVGDIPASGLVFVGYNGTNFEHLNTKHASTADAATSATSSTNSTNATNVTGTIGSAVTATTQAAGDNSTKVATTAYSDAASSLRLLKSSNLSDVANAATALTNLGGLSSSSFTGGNQSLATPGYQKFPGGLIIQWGTVAPNSGATFAIPFPTACAGVQLTSTPVAGGGYPVVTAISTTGFNQNNANNAYYMAVGW